MSEPEIKDTTDFIREIVNEDIASGKFKGRVHTRFPPEPNGYLHIGHAKAICISFGIAEDYPGGLYNLRFDDTNPSKEEVEYVDSIQEDIRWLGFDWQDRLFFASDYFQQMYDYAVDLIKKGKAFVCDLNAEEMREYRGTLKEGGKESPYRERSVEENLDLFERMKKGEFADGSKTLRAKIDMSSPNINMRDPVIYRILNETHHRTGDAWCIYPMYDYAHCIEDSIEGITHSLCSLEFEDHRPLYDWFLDTLDIYHPQQIEFARLNLTNTVMSKRKLLQLVKENHVRGWDDPRMPTISGMRRRGYRAQAIRKFAELVGIAKNNSVIDMAFLEHVIREDLNESSARMMAVLDPLKVIIDNYPEDQVEMFAVPNHPQDPEDESTRQVPFTKEIYIERSDFMEEPPKKYFRLAPGKEVRLFKAYYLTYQSFEKNADGEIIAIHCTYDPESKGGQTPDGRKVRGTIHWVSASHGVKAEIRLYDLLFTSENPNDVEEDQHFTDLINPESLKIVEGVVEPALLQLTAQDRVQFMRQGFFCIDSQDFTKETPVYNRIISLKDSWGKQQNKA
ncbi:MAG: glutamine--tRNA ligase/YqeY domain fusion protein [Anaerolineaceae bacterium]|nr:glutamine--tRNA ligase/YqeY domain fusion protein [Anaerolineaceae bacterium]